MFIKKFLVKSFRTSPSFSHTSLNKVCKSAEEALQGLKSGDKIMVGGFGLCGIPENLIRYIASNGDYKDLWAISCSSGIYSPLLFYRKI